jgi:hypothetical protein
MWHTAIVVLLLAACVRSGAPDPAERGLRPDRHDLAIIDRADALLASPQQWHQQDDRECDDDVATGRYSLFCALHVACVAELGRYEHRRMALQEVRFAVEDATRGRALRHRLMDFNNLPETRFADVKAVLAAARARVREKLDARESFRL